VWFAFLSFSTYIPLTLSYVDMRAKNSVFPLGTYSVLALLFGVASVFLNGFGSTSCHFVESRDMDFDFGPVMRQPIEGLDDGDQATMPCLIWNEQDREELFGSGLRASRVFALLAMALIIAGVLVLSSVSCALVPKQTIMTIVCAFALGALCECLTFVAFADPFVQDTVDGLLGSGGGIAIGSFVTSSLTAVFAALIITKRMNRPRQRQASVHPTPTIPRGEGIAETTGHPNNRVEKGQQLDMDDVDLNS